MSEYIRRSEGPGSIGALLPGAALWHPPTIGSNAPMRNIDQNTHGAYQIPSLGNYGDGIFANVNGIFSGGFEGAGCCGVGDNGNGESLPSWVAPVGILAVIVGGIWWLKRSKEGDERKEELAAIGRYYY